jgi:uncharacterized protein
MSAAKSKGTATPEQKLRALYDLQLIDSKIDKIKTVRGELPLEVQDLEDDVEGLETRLKKYGDDTAELEHQIAEKKNQVKQSEALIKKYNEQQNKVRNNREYDSITKELEYQNLEIQLAEKRIKEFKSLIASKSESLKQAEEDLKGRKADLKSKKKELDEIVEETQREEEILLTQSLEAEKLIDERLLNAYKRIRTASKNGLAVVPIDREASAGSYIKIPPQRQLDVAARQKIIVDEYSGRILVDKELAEEEIAKIEKLIASILKK